MRYVACTLVLACGASAPRVAPSLKDHLGFYCPESKIEVLEKREQPWSVLYGLRACGRYVELEERVEAHMAPEMTVGQVRSFGDLLSSEGYPDIVASAITPLAKDTCQKREFARTPLPHEDPPTSAEIKALDHRLQAVQALCRNAKIRYLGAVKAPPHSAVWFFDAEGTVATAQIVISVPLCGNQRRTHCVSSL